MPTDRGRTGSRDSMRLRSTALVAATIVLFAGGLAAGCGAGSGEGTRTLPSVTATRGSVARPTVALPTAPAATEAAPESTPVFTMPLTRRYDLLATSGQETFAA